MKATSPMPRRKEGCAKRKRIAAMREKGMARAEREQREKGNGLHLFVAGWPHGVGGAGQHCWSVVRLLRSIGVRVTMLPFSKRTDPWVKKLQDIGADICMERKLDRIPGLAGGVVTSFCSGGFIRRAVDLKNMGCRLVWNGCMTWLHQSEREHYRKHGLFDRVIVNSKFQESKLRPQLERVYGFKPEHVVHIPSPFFSDEWKYNPLAHNGEPFTIGRLNRTDTSKYDHNLWKHYGQIRNALGGAMQARCMAWNGGVEKVLGRPPNWAKCMAAGAEPAEKFWHGLHALVYKSGGAQENRPRICFEAMACGVPVVTEDAFGWKELVEHGVTGFLCNTDEEYVEHTRHLAEDESFRMGIIEQARTGLSKLVDLDCIGNRWVSMLNELGSAVPVTATPGLIAGIMAIGPNRTNSVVEAKLRRRCIRSLARQCDVLHVRLDPDLSGTEMAVVSKDLAEIAGGKLGKLIVGKEKWNRWNWREELLRSLDSVHPEVVLCPDMDEEFGPGLKKDIKVLLASDRSAIQFDYEMVTADDVEVPKYPGHSHMKVFKWRPGLSYRDYQGFAAVTNYASRREHLQAKTILRHLCYYSLEMREARGMTSETRGGRPQ